MLNIFTNESGGDDHKASPVRSNWWPFYYAVFYFMIYSCFCFCWLKCRYIDFSVEGQLARWQSGVWWTKPCERECATTTPDQNEWSTVHNFACVYSRRWKSDLLILLKRKQIIFKIIFKNLWDLLVCLNFHFALLVFYIIRRSVSMAERKSTRKSMKHHTTTTKLLPGIFHSDNKNKKWCVRVESVHKAGR